MSLKTHMETNAGKQLFFERTGYLSITGTRGGETDVETQAVILGFVQRHL